MMRLLNGLIAALAALVLLAHADFASAITATPTPPVTPTPGATPAPGGASGNITYSSFPKAAGQRTLIDFDDYGKILANTQAYLIQRYSYGRNSTVPPYNGSGSAGTGTPAAADPEMKKYQDLTGSEDGQPIKGAVRDPDGEVDIRKVRSMTEIDNLFSNVDDLRPDQEVQRKLREESGGAGDAAVPPKSTGITPPAKPAVWARDDMGSVQYTISKEDMSLDNWAVELNSSARTVENRSDSYCKEIKSFKNATTGDPLSSYGDPDPAKNNPYLGTIYLGARIHFPTHKYNAYAKIGPAFDIPAFDSRGLPINYSKFDPDWAAGIDEASPALSYNGVMHNVAQIKNIKVKVAGRNYPHGLAVRLRDENGEVSEYFVGYLDFPGWRFLSWINPNYTTSYTAEELFRIPLYPTEVPYRVFDSFVVYRNGDQEGGDFVVYFAWVKMDFDLAVSPDELEEIDVDDDNWWYIMRDANAERNRRLLEKYAEEIDLRMQIQGRVKRPTSPDRMIQESKTKPPK